MHFLMNTFLYSPFNIDGHSDTCNSSTWETEAGGLITLRPHWAGYKGDLTLKNNTKAWENKQVMGVHPIIPALGRQREVSP